MAYHKVNQGRPVPSANGDLGQTGTRAKLLEAAGHVFGEKGFDRATGKEICGEAGVVAGAVNYHFGEVEGLYAAVVKEAVGRIFPHGAWAAGGAEGGNVEAALAAFFGRVVRAANGADGASWPLKVVARELAAPTPALASLREKGVFPAAGPLRSAVGRLMGLPDDHPAVALGCVGVLAPCFLLLTADRRTLTRAFPALGLGDDDVDAVVRHLVRFTLAGLTAVAAGVTPERC
jgi:AcrR family transcriptional regulator